MAVFDLETKKFYCECGCGKECNFWNRFNKGHHMRTEENRKRQADIASRTIQTEGAHRKSGQSRVGHEVDEATRRAISETMTGWAVGEETRRQISDALFGRPHTEEHRRHNREARLEQWQDLEFASYMRRRGFGIGCNTPNKMELLLWEDIKRYLPLGWEMNVEIGRRLAGMVPDFLNETKKQVIELFGDYYHNTIYFDGKSEEETIRLYREEGRDCVVVWESDVRLGFPDSLERFMEAYSEESCCTA